MKAYKHEIDQFKRKFYTGIDGLKAAGIPITRESMLASVKSDLRDLTVKMNGMKEVDWTEEQRIASLALRELTEELS